MDKSPEELTREKHENTERHTHGREDFFCSDVFIFTGLLIFPAIMSTAIPESTHIPLRAKLILLSMAFLPLVINRIYAPQNYLAVQRTIFLWLCNSFVLVVADLVDSNNAQNGVYNCSDDCSDLWLWKSDYLLFFAFIGLFSLFLPVVGIFTVFDLVCKSSPSKKSIFFAFSALSMTVWLISPTFWKPETAWLLRPIRPLQTSFATALISFTLSAENAPEMFVWFSASGCLALIALNLWTFAQFDNFFISSLGISGSMCYTFVVLMIVEDKIERSHQAAQPTSRTEQVSPTSD